MKVKFLKDHLRHRAGEVADIIEPAANYFIKCNVAVQYAEEARPSPAREPQKKKRGK